MHDHCRLAVADRETSIARAPENRFGRFSRDFGTRVDGTLAAENRAATKAKWRLVYSLVACGEANDYAQDFLTEGPNPS